MFTITLEKKDALREIQRRFEAELSPQEIHRSTARALNNTAKTVQGFIKKQIRETYTMKPKYLKRMSTITHYAVGNYNSLYTHIDFSYRPVPMSGFKFTGGKRGKRTSLISVEIKKGQSQAFRHAFLASMRNMSREGEMSEHQGIYAAGRYQGKKFVYDGSKTASGRTRITELKTASPFTAATGKELEMKIAEYVARTLPARLEFFLRTKLDKMKKPL